MRRAALLLLALLMLALLGGAVADGGRGKEGRAGKGDDREGDADGERRGDDDERAPKGREARDEDDDEEGEDEERDRDRPRKVKRGADDRAGPASEPSGTSTPAPSLILTGDAALRQSTRVEPGRLSYVLAVGGLGLTPAEGVRLTAELPDLGSPWVVNGAGAKDCRMEGQGLACDFGDLAVGDVRLLQVATAVTAAPAWEVESTASLDAGNDREPGNDEATSVVGVLLT